ncbi:MAG: hypothetical protein ACFCVD_09930 [Nodosilinea sp.]
MFFILLVLALVGFSTSLVLHIKAILCLLPEPERPGRSLIFDWWDLHFALVIANASVLILEKFWDGNHFVQFLRSIWAFLPAWTKWTIASLIVYLAIVLITEFNQFRILPGKRRIYKQNGKYWNQPIDVVQRTREGRQVLEEINLEPIEISKGQYFRAMGYADSFFPGLWVFNYFLLALYFWYKID